MFVTVQSFCLLFRWWCRWGLDVSGALPGRLAVPSGGAAGRWREAVAATSDSVAGRRNPAADGWESPRLPARWHEALLAFTRIIVEQLITSCTSCCSDAEACVCTLWHHKDQRPIWLRSEVTHTPERASHSLTSHVCRLCCGILLFYLIF